MILYRKYLRMISFGYNDYSKGTPVSDWIPEEDFNPNDYSYECEYVIKEKYVRQN